ncbi:protein translocase subunit SecD [Marinicella sp. S1101]|uniref:protein translocase subunit SecD n=1 Tax=Marinicella marina TaxID=2996016 RepID=UPI002260CBDD|nr:protein translocase subunit SecD [Marinicella marina]MCX7553628.1 protein translocase subunit SecD [Marinicella marina]MDJ1140252.1 protein translocase subunit SecD [Marinicella marina]
MNRYPLWKYLLILAVICMGALYALPNIYGQSPVVQVSAKDDVAVTENTLERIETLITDAGLEHDRVVIDGDSAVVKFSDLDAQRKAQDLLKEKLGGFDTAMNLKPNVPDWLADLGGSAMNLGLDLRGGVHFLLEVDMKDATANKKRQIRSDVTATLVKQKIPKRKILWKDNELTVGFRTQADLDKAVDLIEEEFTELTISTEVSGDSFDLKGLLTEQSLNAIKENALTQNLSTLRSRVNEIGVAEPIIQRQGLERIVVQLPGVQDTTAAKNILDATATLEYRPTDMENNAQLAAQTGRAPVGSTLYYEKGVPVLLKNRVIATGNQLIDAQATFDQQSGSPAVSVQLNSMGAARMLEFTKNNVGNLMGVVLKERIPLKKDEVTGEMQYRVKEEVISNARINGIFSNRFQTTGLGTQKAASELALLLRAGALAAPVQIVEERTIGPSLGQENIDRGVMSVQIGLAMVLVFMLFYYRMFGLIANIALTINVVLMVACLSLFGATLTLPGIAGIVLTVGMAVDANVLIFERIKEELREGNTVQGSIKSGYDKAFSTIADANVTTLIAAVVLFAFGTGPIKGFAVTLSIGIMTSMFTAIVVSRAIVNLIYGRKKRLQSIAI